MENEIEEEGYKLRSTHYKNNTVHEYLKLEKNVRTIEQRL